MPIKDRAKRLAYLDKYRADHRPPPQAEAQPDNLPAIGTIEFDEAGERVRCHACGRWYRALNGHLRTHGHDEASYKEAYGLKRTASLLPPATAEKFRQAALARDQGSIGRDYLPRDSTRPTGLANRLQNRIEASEARRGINQRAGEKTNKDR